MGDPGEDTKGNGYYPAPFPGGLPTIDLKTISIAQLYAADHGAGQKLFDILCNEGFFYLDLNTDQRGQELLKPSLELHNAAKDVFNNVSVPEKETWRGDPLKGVLDTGYRGLGKDETGQPRIAEVLNVPTYNLIHDDGFKLPAWLDKYKEAYQGFAKYGHEVGQALLASLERELHLESGALTKIHELSDGTGGFVRMFRLPAPQLTSKPDAPASPPTPAHTDGNSITILCNWQGGLQIARPKQDAQSRQVRMIDDASRMEDEWLWVEPRPGHVIVNLGDPMVVLSNGILASGRHRVVTPPGEQAKHDRYSVLVGLRPQSDTPMRPLKSDIIRLETEEEKAKPTVTALEYAVNKVRAILERTDKSRSS